MVINTNALHKYKLTDDIFKKITVVPDGKNHVQVHSYIRECRSRSSPASLLLRMIS